MLSRAVTFHKQTKETNGLVRPPDLGRPIASLAEHIRKAMAALYDVHTALLKCHSPDSVVDQFVKSRDTFRAECETITTLLQLSHGNAEDFVSLCQFSLSRPMSDCLALAEDILHGSRNILKEARVVKAAHETKLAHLTGQKRGLTAVFNRRATLPLVGRYMPFNLFSKNLERSASEKPAGALAVTASFTALEGISRDMQDLVAFWSHQTQYLVEISSKQRMLPVTEADVVPTVELWKRYQSIILDAISSISESSDALTVSPPRPSASPPRPVSVSWDKIRAMIPRGR